MDTDIYSLEAVPVAEDSRLALTAPACVICGSSQLTPVLEVDRLGYYLFRCEVCGLGRLWPVPEGAALQAFYPVEYYGSSGNKFGTIVELGVRWVASRHVRFLSQQVPPGGRILDIGCGRGIHLHELAERGFAVHGFEVSAHATKGIDPRVQLAIAPSLQEVRYPDQYFDEIIIWHVYEHVPDPVALLVEMQRILKPGGKLILSVPNYSSYQASWAGPAWFHLDLPRHLFHFPAPAVRQLLTTHGFEIVSEHHFSLRQNPFGWLQSALNKFGIGPRNGLYILLHDRPPTQPAPYTWGMRLLLRLAFVCGMPIGVALSIWEALLRNGGTVNFVARNTGTAVSGP